ncbi:Hypothetical predicted protein [Olea europaea subsp. europaea]|uniref:Uncharacterized protein n=1 Tax=Olea europaea subsp. europaea TaxID=158383 RepID=A0A8S0TGV3_OLEEU|nr:Hypothetical predicted protein [Olea europaea subsp. europaea]
MEKSRSYPQYSSSCSTEFGYGFQDRANSYIFNGPTTKDEAFAASNDPEMKRKKRIAAYNMFTREGKVKASVRESFKWIKSKFDDISVVGSAFSVIGSGSQYSWQQLLGKVNGEGSILSLRALHSRYC